jgi:mannose-6-phosphate isomerase-like protein (cupin superfamily)
LWQRLLKSGEKMGRKINVVSRSSNKNAKSLGFEQNSWINYTILDIGSSYKVKRFEVLPLKQLSFQKSKFHEQHWTIVQGTAKVTINDQIFSVKAGETIDVDKGKTSCVENPDNSEILVFINVQCGVHIGKDEVIRFSEDLGRIADNAGQR